MSELRETTPKVGEDKMSNGADAAVPSGAAAARSEPEQHTEVIAAIEEVAEEPTPKTVDFRGATLTLPDSLPGTVALDYAEVEDGRKQVSPIVNLIKSIIGPEQYNEQVYDKIKEDKVTVDQIGDVLSGLMEDLFAAYGTAEGESEASEPS